MRKGWLSALSMLAAASLLASPAWGAENVKKSPPDAVKRKTEQSVEPIQSFLKHAPRPARNKTSSNQAVSSIHIKGTVKNFNEHYYYFETTAAGKLKISATVDPAINLIVLSSDGSRTYWANDNLPPGTYYLAIWALGKDGNYDITLSGPEFQAIDESLPKVEMDPPTPFTRLPKGERQIRIGGYFENADYVLIENNGRIQYKLTASPFPVIIKADLGHNLVRAAAVKASGNISAKVAPVTAPGLLRIGGKDRYEVSAGISRESHPDGSKYVVLTRGDLFTDAMSGGPLASALNAPLLITTPTKLPDPIRTEIRRLKPDKVFILGGTASVSPSIEKELRSQGIGVERIGGANRFEVSVRVAERMMQIQGSDREGAPFIASGLVFPDALSASAWASRAPFPVLLTLPDRLPHEVATFIDAHKNFRQYYIVGGPATVSENVKRQTDNFAHVDRVIRIGGRDRYEVAVNLYNYFDPSDYASSQFILAKGTDFPDALSGGPLAASKEFNLFLTPPDHLHPAVKRVLQSDLDAIYLLGGPGSIAPQLEKTLWNMIP
jgi:putative cell wall-binding protein